MEHLHIIKRIKIVEKKEENKFKSNNRRKKTKFMISSVLASFKKGPANSFGMGVPKDVLVTPMV